MLDVNLINTQTEKVKELLQRKNYDIKNIDILIEIYNKNKKVQQELDELRSQRNVLSKQIGKLNKDDKEIVNIKAKVIEVNNKIEDLEKDVNINKEQINALLYDIPNLPDEDAPVGLDESDNVVLTQSDDHYVCPIENPLPHYEIGKTLNIFDEEMATKMSGSMFALFKGKGARLLRALIGYGFELHQDKYLEILPPHLVTTQSLTYTGHLPKFANDQYKCINDDSWLIPTAEVPLTASFAKTTFKQGELPVRRMAYTVAFRREAGKAGNQNRGLQRVHEFHKVELLKIVEPEQCEKELQDLFNDCLKIIKDLKLQYRILDLCSGDMGDKYARCYDIEVYSPGVKRWLEVGSIGHFSDYQARRGQIKYIDKDGNKKIAYTMNGSGIATPRVWAAIIETYQQPDGSIKVPEVLVPYMGCEFIK